ncbi:Chitinase [Pseudopedobacter saltans DSM 12145]|uniref:chitinase n=1 Tax=Pseudopedobacter saltans (strain ATCC 51119 / DSM 12145 / JCM 21818 / CCUG 39354 / LMG 10337 / NBRC 100064 / NCIMB 13643) TaxID=762903 RepID=F0SCL2_PSESL|nr:glycoside hydrolase family 18 protein [Pseudopedobacter saltans]ADY53856.1 Chitinase [Pseudopedobacter saltans DSM 12145]
MKEKLLNLSFVLLAFFSFKSVESKEKPKVIVAYVTSWSSVKPDPFLMTHINYAFGHVSQDFKGVRVSNESRLREVVTLRTKNPKLKVLLSIGGWGSGNFSEMAASDTLRKSFAKDCSAKVKEFDLDGIDIDWEYPTSNAAGISASPADYYNFTLLMRDIREEIGKKKLLTLATAASAEFIDFKGINPYIDFVNVMTYDMATPPFHHAGLYRSEFTKGLSVEEAILKHFNAGVPYDKLVMGIPFYGRGNKEIGGFTNYRNILELKGYERKWDEVSKVPYLVDSAGNFVCTYEDSESIAYKTEFIKKMGLLGGMYWDYAGDTNDAVLAKKVKKGLL